SWQPNYFPSRSAASPYSLISAPSPGKKSASDAPRAEITPVARPQPAVASPEKGPTLPISTGGAGGHAPDYRWVVGVLEKDEAHGRGYGRYAEASAADPKAGALELVGIQTLGGLEAGQRVRVEGERIDAAPHQAHAAYRVRAIIAVGLLVGK